MGKGIEERDSFAATLNGFVRLMPGNLLDYFQSVGNDATEMIVDNCVWRI